MDYIDIDVEDHVVFYNSSYHSSFNHAHRLRAPRIGKAQPFFSVTGHDYDMK